MRTKHKDKRFSKEAGIVICHCECQYNRPCPVPETGPCKVAKDKRASRIISATLID